MDSVKKILCVDDEPNILVALQRVFRSEEYDITTSTNGEEALELLKQGHQPHVILLDAKMPVMTGYEFIEQVRESNNYLGPIILLTGDVKAEQFFKNYPHQENLFYITKPIDNDYIKSVVDYLLVFGSLPPKG